MGIAYFGMASAYDYILEQLDRVIRSEGVKTLCFD